IIDWLVTYGHLEIGAITIQEGEKEKEVETFTRCKGNAGQHEKAIRQSLDDAKKTMWWSFQVPNDFKGFDADKALRSVLKRVRDAQDKIDAGERVADNASITMPS